MKAVVFTLGCKVNECESDSLISGLKEKGYEVTNKLEYADVYIVNTCAVTAEAEKKSRQTASRITKLNPDAKIIFTGCACQKDSKAFLQKSNRYLVTGTFNKNKILEMLDSTGENISPETKAFEELLPVNSLRTRTFIKIQDGCNNFCSYCIIPYLRGRSRSRSGEKILREINLVNPLEAILSGIDISSYNDEGRTLADLLKTLSSVSCRIRLGSLEVKVIDENLLNATKSLKNFAPHFHLSLQSGSNDVLRSMNRKYRVDEFIEKVNLIRKYYPFAGITTDIIAGFPTETEEDFSQTIKLVETVKFSDIHPFSYSPRSGTVAYKLKDLSSDVKKARLNKLIGLKEKLKLEFEKSMVGKVLEMLPEQLNGGYCEGYTENYLRAYLKSDTLEKNIIKVKVLAPFCDGVLVEKI